ncbi:MAG: hypothetical protein HY509_03665 [Acidobacteria bacterium]|nr:hypothetical protein [Acidobacteriota bacterium]
MIRAPAPQDDPFLPPWFERTANSVGGLALAEMVLRYGFHPELRPWQVFLGDGIEILAAVVGILRLPVRAGLRRLRLRAPLPSTLDLLLGAAAAVALLHGRLAWGAALGILRQAIVAIRMVLRSRGFHRALLLFQARPTRILALSFLGTILLGTLLLMLPAATADGRGAPPITALFTSASAVCVTGLAVVDTGTYFSRFGQAVILGLIQVGGWGIMTLSAAVALLAGHRLGLRTRAVMQNLFEAANVEGLFRILRFLFLITLAIEAIGAGILFLRWREILPDPGRRIYFSVFHSVSAFCNAGFSLFSDNLAGPAGADPFVLLDVSGLIILGGIGFTTINSFLSREIFRRGLGDAVRHLTTQTRIVLVVSGLLLVLGTLLIFFFEFDRTLETMPAGEKLLTAFFQSVTPRTAGFHRVDTAQLAPATAWVTMILMFIGAAPGSTGGGIKVTTLGVLALSVKAMLQGREDVEVRGRTIPKTTVYRAVAVTVISATAVGGFLLLLLATQAEPFDALLFEAVSAFANVGLSLGITPDLDTLGQGLLVLLMYVGRIGPLTLTLAIGEQLHPAAYRYPEARLLVG